MKDNALNKSSSNHNSVRSSNHNSRRSNHNSGRSNHNSGLSDETLETIRKFELEQKRSNRSSRKTSGRLIDEINQNLLDRNNYDPELQTALAQTMER